MIKKMHVFEVNLPGGTHFVLTTSAYKCKEYFKGTMTKNRVKIYGSLDPIRRDDLTAKTANITFSF